ncbi:hypothetical protein CAPTEDRAFT_227081 [Capitella teleta]|uniref:NEDD8 ultimate buster 1 n=1 Tax=Capitella teleta TaxID=283909 RepID=R7UXM0_CAPTE|nr:hypothetical protein CAPTEDRAFT_227081 [Capitella teleta]|eukprot:ELU11079.1 hypothetical protein CAPTEDRAFT_227081 [Capitella teleta]
MDSNREELLKEKLRHCLNRDQVKLWLTPYTLRNEDSGIYPDELVSKYAAELHLEPVAIRSTLESLRVHALEKLAARNKFNDTGIACIKLRMAGICQEGIDLEISLDKTGFELREIIRDRHFSAAQQLKVICKGRVIRDDAKLAAQGVKNGSQCMVLCQTKAVESVKDDDQKKVHKTREAAEVLSNIEDESDDYYVQIADQNGKSLNLPTEERKALMLAMTLHEKGRSALKQKDYEGALLLLLEADSEFSKCRADILNSVDNYALVCLDVVWCYLLLRNINDLPDAERKLKACEDCFKRSYGQNLERLTLVKGGTGSERALFMRLHLLQAVLAFHQQKLTRAKELLAQAEMELQILQVDEEKLAQVMELGYSVAEARLSLRQCGGDVQEAVAFISNRKEEKIKLRKVEKENKRKRKLEAKLGPTADGSKINIDVYEDLLRLGFPKGAAAEALKQVNNSLDQALQVLQDHPELLSIKDPDPIPITDEMIAQVSDMGFTALNSKAALHHFNGSAQQAIEHLLSNGGEIPADWVSDVEPAASTSKSGGASGGGVARQREAFEEINDISKDEDDYLDLMLTEEAEFLQEYKSLLQL